MKGRGEWLVDPDIISFLLFKTEVIARVIETSAAQKPLKCQIKLLKAFIPDSKQPLKQCYCKSMLMPRL